MRRSRSNRIAVSPSVDSGGQLSPSAVRLNDVDANTGLQLFDKNKEVTTLTFGPNNDDGETTVPLVLGNASENVMWRQYRHHTAVTVITSIPNLSSHMKDIKRLVC